MEPVTFVIVMAVAALGSYVQAVAGFAFGLIFMSVIGSLRLIDIADAALVVSLLAALNTSLALYSSSDTRGWRQVAWPQVATVLIFGVPSIAGGLWLLQTLSAGDGNWLRAALGTTVLVSSLAIVRPPKPGRDLSPLPVFAVFGVLGGVVGGMFATFGAPVIYQFYRQNLPLPRIRDSLLAIFAVTTASRATFAWASTGIDANIWLLCAASVPVVLGFTWLGKHRPPPLGEIGLRRFAAGLVGLAGSALLIPAAIALVG